MEEVKKRREKADLYLKNINNNTITLPKPIDANSHVWHLFVIKLKNRENISAELKKLGIETIIHYPIPINKQKAYSRHFQAKEKFSNSDKSSKKILSLPIFPKMKKTEINHVISVVKKLINQ